MLTQLTVKNFALVDRLELDFHAGMTVVTGETGAGKSIMLDAIGLTLGDRADTGLIGDQGEKSDIVASFDISQNKEALTWLKGKELLDDSQECLLRRVISRDGRSKGFINGAPSNVSDLKTLGEMLIDIHSQHEHQSLLRKDNHARLLDEYAGVQNLSQEVLQIFQTFQLERRRIDSLIENNQEQSARIQLLSYQAEELQQLAVTEGECESLEAEQKKLANAEDVLGNCQQALKLCSEDDDNSAAATLGKSIQLLEQLQLPEVTQLIEMLSSARIQVEEACVDLSRFSGDFEIDPNRLSQVEDRLSVIYNLSRKHKVESHQIPQLESSINTELEGLKNIDEQILNAETEISNLIEHYRTKAEKLSKKRRGAAKKLMKQVSLQLTQLGMSGAYFDIALSKQADDKPSARGLEEIEFLISTNPGQTPKPLNKIASGGELSRISLAIQVATADTSDIPTLVFDEVDVGIGGGIAEVVGNLLRALGKKAQIVCVTHLAQVAAQGHQHLLVEKTKDKKRARTSIANLGGTGRIEELARMMGGIEMTNQTLAHAQEMFEAAQV